MSKDNQTRKQDNSIFSKVNTRLILMLAGLVTVIIIVVVVFTVPKAAYAKKVREQLDLGEKYLSELDYESAVVAYRTAIIIDPKAEDAYLGLADAYLEMGEPGKAVEILESAEKELTSEAITDKQKAAKRAKKKQEQEQEPTNTPTPTNVPTPTEIAEPIEKPIPTEEPLPTNTPIPTPTDILVEILEPTIEPEPTDIPVLPITQEPEPVATSTPVPTKAPTPTSTPVPTVKEVDFNYTILNLNETRSFKLNRDAKEWFKVDLKENQTAKVSIYTADGTPFEDDLYINFYTSSSLKAGRNDPIGSKRYQTNWGNEVKMTENFMVYETGDYYLEISGGIHEKQLEISYIIIEPDAQEGNGTYQTATVLKENETKKITITASNNEQSRDYDWYKLSLQANQTAKVTIQTADGTPFEDDLYINFYTSSSLKAGRNDPIGSKRYQTNWGNEVKMTENFMVYETGDYYLEISGGIHEKQLEISYIIIEPDAQEGNGTYQTATVLKENETKKITITASNNEQSRDYDWYKLSLQANQTAKVTIQTADGTPFEDDLYISFYTNSSLKAGKNDPIGSKRYQTNWGNEVKMTENFMVYETGDYYLEISGGIHEKQLEISYTIIEPDAQEGNGTYQTATVLKENETKKITITASNNEQSRDYDWYKLSLQANQTAKVTIQTADGTPFEDDLYISFYTNSSLKAGKNDPIGSKRYQTNWGNEVKMTENFKVSETGDYYLNVSGGIHEKPLKISYVIE